MVSSPVMADFTVSDKVLHQPHRHSKHGPQITPPTAAAKGRKRGRSRGHNRRSELQEEVRFLLQESLDDNEMDLDDDDMASPPLAADRASEMLAPRDPAVDTRDARTPTTPAGRESGRVSAISSDGKKRKCLSARDFMGV